MSTSYPRISVLLTKTENGFGSNNVVYSLAVFLRTKLFLMTFQNAKDRPHSETLRRDVEKSSHSTRT